MSTKLPDSTDSYNLLFQNVHSRVFFDTLAANGIQPHTEKEAQDLFRMAGHLREVEQQEKAASDRFSGPLAALEGVLGVRSPSSPARDLGIKQAADQLMNVPEIYNAVLSLKAEEAAQLAKAAA